MLNLAAKMIFNFLILFRKNAITPPQAMLQALRCGLR